MSPANVKIEPAASSDGAVRREPAVESDGPSSTDDPWSGSTSEVDERVPEEAGYGYGV